MSSKSRDIVAATEKEDSTKATQLCYWCTWTNLLDHEDPYRVGTPDDIRKKGKAGCELCVFWSTLLDIEPRVHNDSIQAGGYITRKVTVGGHSWKNEESLCLSIDGVVAAEVAAFPEFSPASPPKSIIAPYISSGVTHRPPCVDPKLVHMWLQRCDTAHTDCHASRQTHAIDILLVDISRHCITKGCSTDRFLALSYVSGGQIGFRTLKSNKALVLEENSLLDIREQGHLPRVIEDALDFAAALGERYIWIDSLCIVQDDEASKHEQIAQMHIIYNQAYLTLISVSGMTARDPLPGVISGSRPAIKLTKKVVFDDEPSVILAAASPGLFNILRASPYETRGWTFQERLLSCRCLYFTNWEAFFHCPTELRSELYELGNENPAPVINAINTTSRIPENQLGRLRARIRQNKPSTGPKVDLGMDFLAMYFDLVDNYTVRALRHQSDIISAFAGIMGLFQDLGWSTFTFGLPDSYLDIALLWMPLIGKSTSFSSAPDNRTADQPFPSWSWCSWEGPVLYPRLINNSTRRKCESLESWFRSEVQWIGGNTVYPSADLVDSNSSASCPRDMNRTREVTIPSLCTSIKGISTLVFSASVVEAGQFEYGQGQIKANASDVLDANKKQCGVLLDDLDYIRGADIASCQLVLLSRSRFKDHSKDSDRFILDNQFARPLPGDNIYEKIEVFNYDYITTYKQDEWAMNVMLVKRTAECSRRVAIGFIHERAWNTCHHEMRTISLI